MEKQGVPSREPKDIKRTGLLAEAYIKNGQPHLNGKGVICLLLTTGGQRSARLSAADDSSKYAPAPVLTEWANNLPPSVGEIIVKDPITGQIYRYKNPKALRDSGVESIDTGRPMPRFTAPSRVPEAVA